MFITFQSSTIHCSSIVNIHFNHQKNSLIIVTDQQLYYILPNITPTEIGFCIEDYCFEKIMIEDGQLLIDNLQLKKFAMRNIALWENVGIHTYFVCMNYN